LKKLNQFTKYNLGVKIGLGVETLLHLQQSVTPKSYIVNTAWAFEKVECFELGKHQYANKRHKLQPADSSMSF
jgi:hypothetical protein